MTLAESLDVRRDEILRIARQHGARNIRLFGSAATGQETPASDVDLLVEFEPGRSLLDVVAIRQDLEEVLGRKVDVVNERTLHWYLRDRILAQARPL